MTEDTKPGANREVASDKPTRPRKGQVRTDCAAPERLKTALFAALDRTGLNLKEIAERCRLESANALYNLKNGHSETLSIQTYVALATYLNLPMSELLGIAGPEPARGTSKPGAPGGPSYAEVVHDIVALQLQAEMFRHAIHHGLSATAALLQRQVVEQPPLSDPGFRIKLIHDIVILQTAMEQINLQARALVDAIEQTMPPQQAATSA